MIHNVSLLLQSVQLVHFLVQPQITEKTFTFYVDDEVQQLGDQENIGNVRPTDNISKMLLKMPKRINHKGETMLHVLAIKVNIKIVLCNI